ncbi:glycosyltransferase [Aliiruegeria haliotis]|uniref:glycosyltransferase n=1 Tax=Aliiruegeria haliotis TaxID=1280846 RepID=UPI001FE28ECD|nr:glycosyltransferase [Aliiruegeria haliotis]
MSGQPARVIEGDAPDRKLLGQRLLESRRVEPGNMVKALAMQARQDARLGDILLSNGMISEGALMKTLSEQWGTEVIDLDTRAPDARMIDSYGAVRCLRDGLVPWQRAGSTVIVATSRPEKFANHRPSLEAEFGSVTMALCTEGALHRSVCALRNPALAARAEHLVPPDLSCRRWRGGVSEKLIAAACIAALVLALLFPVPVFSALAIWAVVTLGATLALKTGALVVALRRAALGRGTFHTQRESGPTIARLPTVSVMVPLFKEEDVAGRLVKRLSRLAYPKELMDILLVVEETDKQTQDVLAATELPRWMRVVIVPKGGVQTKPRALNYALDFCRGQIVGVWDAEDAPEADQLHKVVRRFHERGPTVACLQGALDYYNARTNWLSRCFTIEYASWFRVVLPGLQRMGLAMPLGGTTLYFRREALEKMGGWDAHNVTEDADLGMRLVRMGYRTEMVDTTTHEEANCRVLPWIKQRSRWLKGYAMTWAVHMRDPRQLWQDLGPWRFLGFQILFLGTLSQFVLAPVLWSFWGLALGLPHPLAGVIPALLFWPMVAVFLGSEVVNLLVGILGARAVRRAHLFKWVPTMHAYFPLAAFASYKAFYEILTRPFYWDKTSHGFHDEHDDLAARAQDVDAA